MSFYGKVTYYLSDAFKQQIYDNEGIDTVDSAKGSGAINSIITLNPKGKDDACTIKSGNTWLRFAADPIQDTSVYLYHKLAGNDDGITMDNSSLNVTKSSSENADVSLAFGEIITIPQIVYDAAGHIQPTSRTVTVKMPQAAQEQDLDNIKHRLAVLEAYVTGQSSEPDPTAGGGSEPGGGGEEPGGGGSEDPGDEGETIVVDNPLMSRLTRVENHIASWLMPGDPNTSDVPNQSYLEEQGIGTTLHDLLVFLGLQQERLDALTGRMYYQDVSKGQAFPIYNTFGRTTVLPTVSDAYTLSNSAILATTQLKSCLSDLIGYLYSGENPIIDETTYNALMGQLSSN